MFHCHTTSSTNLIPVICLIYFKIFSIYWKRKLYPCAQKLDAISTWHVSHLETGMDDPKNFHTANAMLIYKVQQHAKKEDNGNLVSLSYLVYLSKKNMEKCCIHNMVQSPSIGHWLKRYRGTLVLVTQIGMGWYTKYVNLVAQNKI